MASSTSAPAIPKLHPVFSPQTHPTLNSIRDESHPKEHSPTSVEPGGTLESPLDKNGTSPLSKGPNSEPQHQPPAQGWTARALYDFDGQAEFSELSFRAGDVLTVIKVGLAEGWSLAEKDGAKGLIPESYITYIHDFSVSPPGSINHTQHASVASVGTAYSTATVNQSMYSPGAIGMPPGSRHSVFGKRQLNRFSWFVTSGVEEFILTGGVVGSSRNKNNDPSQAYSSGTLDVSTLTKGELHGILSGSTGPQQGTLREGHSAVDYKSSDGYDDEDDEVTESDKHYIQSGPSWQEKAPFFQVKVHDPETRRKMAGMQEYTLFQVTSTFAQGATVTVERRYSQFEWLYDRLVIKFGALALPLLPEKQFSGRFSDEFIERRRRALERFLNRLARHPVMRYSDLLTHFLSCNDDGDWKRAERKFEVDPIVGSAFFQHVYHPEFNVAEDGDIDLIEKFKAHCSGSERLLPILLEASLAHKLSVEELQFNHKRLGLSLLNLVSGSKESTDQTTLNGGLAWCWRENCTECLRLTKAIQMTAESFHGMTDVHQAHSNDGCLSWLETLKEYSTPSTTFAPLVDMHTGTHKKLIEVYEKEQVMEEIDSETVKSRCDTVFNVTLAEIDRFHDERTEDLRKGTEDFLDAQIAYHEKMLERLKQTRAVFDQPYYDNLSKTPRSRSKLEKDLGDQRHQPQRPSRPVSSASVASMSSVVGGVVDGVGFMNGFLRSKTRTSVGKGIMGLWS